MPTLKSVACYKFHRNRGQIGQILSILGQKTCKLSHLPALTQNPGYFTDFFNETLFPRVKLNKEYVPELRFCISRNKIRTPWFTACVFR